MSMMVVSSWTQRPSVRICAVPRLAMNGKVVLTCICIVKSAPKCICLMILPLWTSVCDNLGQCPCLVKGSWFWSHYLADFVFCQWFSRLVFLQLILIKVLIHHTKLCGYVLRFPASCWNSGNRVHHELKLFCLIRQKSSNCRKLLASWDLQWQS